MGPARPPRWSYCWASAGPTPAWSACSAGRRPMPSPPAGLGPCCRTPACPREPGWPSSSAWSAACTPRRAFWQRVRAYVAGGRTVLFATHRLEEADAVADRVVVISGGRLLADGTPDQVKAQAAARSTVSLAADGLSRMLLEGLPGVAAVEEDRGRLTLHTSDPDATIRALLQHAPTVQGLEVRRAGMEEAFLQLTHEEGGTS